MVAFVPIPNTFIELQGKVLVSEFSYGLYSSCFSFEKLIWDFSNRNRESTESKKCVMNVYPAPTPQV